jgi:aryl-alcohol dehydrogenase-like predicted oxidoreductase
MRPTLRQPTDFDPANPFDRVVLGTASLGGLRGAVDRAEAVNTVVDALRAGVTRIDTAPMYGNAQEIVGEALAQWTGPKPWISTKAGVYRKSGVTCFDFAPTAIEQSVRDSCRYLGIAQIDCLFVHGPERMSERERQPLVETLLALKAAGVAKMLGLGGGHISVWRALLETGQFSAAISFNRFSAATSEALAEDLPELRRAKAAFFGASLLHAGLLGDRADIVTAKPPALLSAQTIENARRVRALAAESGCTVDFLAHRFVLSAQEMDFLIIGAANRAQLAGTLNALQQGPLDQGQFDAVCSCQR